MNAAFVDQRSTVTRSRDKVSSLEGHARKIFSQARRVIYLVRYLFRMRVVSRDENGKDREDEGGDNLLPGNLAEWRNNLSYATFPDWRAA